MARKKKPAPVITHKDRLRWRLVRGYLPYLDCLKIVGIRQSDFRGYVRAGKVPPPEHTPECYYYTIEQLRCLIEAKFYAIIDKGTYIIFSLARFSEYLKQHWPLGEEDEQVLAGNKKRPWRRRDNHSQSDHVQSGFGDT